MPFKICNSKQGRHFIKKFLNGKVLFQGSGIAKREDRKVGAVPSPLPARTDKKFCFNQVFILVGII